MLKMLFLMVAGDLLLAPSVQADDVLSLDGVWFRCEFAHSQIPPEDNCRMLDDDGFEIIEGVVHHVKVSNSEETECRHHRVGNCFLQSQVGLEANRSEIGPIEISGRDAKVTWLGCTQAYDITNHRTYLDIKPADELCWWASDKHYYVARYRGAIDVAVDE